MRIRLRKGEEKDISEMSALFRSTVLTVNAADYTLEETRDWASCGEARAHWETLMNTLHFVVAETIEERVNKAVPEARNGQEKMVGFASIREDGYLHSMFVHPDCQRCGVATALLQALERYAEEQGTERIWSEVSLTARPFFEEESYRVTKQQRRRANKLELTNFVMEKRLARKDE